jgi:hypothetical protein
MEAMDFFRMSAGKWRSQRTTHHLAFRRAEQGGSEIYVEPLPADDARVMAICAMHEVDAGLAIGGAYVKWDGTMAWDKEDETHSGETVFALVPDSAAEAKPEEPKGGRLLRERGYAEIVPVVGRYYVDADNALVLTTDYSTMSSIERFWFPEPDVRIRMSGVQSFGGYSTATFCTEVRITDAPISESIAPAATAVTSVFGW